MGVAGGRQGVAEGTVGVAAGRWAWLRGRRRGLRLRGGYREATAWLWGTLGDPANLLLSTSKLI